jgi:hypothetical protein
LLDVLIAVERTTPSRNDAALKYCWVYMPVLLTDGESENDEPLE